MLSSFHLLRCSLLVGLASSAGNTCRHDGDDNFGVAGADVATGGEPAKVKPFDPSGAEHVNCNFQWKEYDQESMAVLNYYPNTDKYERYYGFDMVPARNWEYYEHELAYPHMTTRLTKWEMGKNGPKDQTQTIKLGECNVQQEDGGAWVVGRIGPFYSNGGYDWWQIGVRDTFRLSEVLQKHPEGIHFSTTFTGAVKEDGTILGYPPVHMHHIHVTPQPGVKKKVPASTGGLITNLAMEQHGDYQCLPKDGGVNCFFEVPASGNVKEIDRVLDLEGEINDVRAPNSPTMVWYYQYAIRWHPKSSSRHPVSQMFFVKQEPFLRLQPQEEFDKAKKIGYQNAFQTPGSQIEELMTFDLDTSESTVAWGSGNMGFGGELVRNKIHSHNVMFDRSFWFRATPEELGLIGGKLSFPFHNPYETTLLKNTGAKSFDELEKYLFDNLAQAALNYDKTCPQKASFLQHRTNSSRKCDYNKPFLVCRVSPQNEDVYDETLKKSFIFDRRARTCCNPWKWQAGETWTVVGFFRPITRPLGPWLDTIPKLYPQHLHWVMTFHLSFPNARKDHSYYILTGYAPKQNEPGVMDNWAGGPSAFLTGSEGDNFELILANPEMYSTDEVLRARSFSLKQKWPDGLHGGAYDYGGILENYDDEASMMQSSLEHINQDGRNNIAIRLIRRLSRQSSVLQLCGVLAVLLATFSLARVLRKTSRFCKATPYPVATCACAPPCCPCVQLKHVQKRS